MDRTERFANVPLFTGLEPPEIVGLLEDSEEIEARPGDVLMRQGDPGSGLFLVASGAYTVRREGLEEPLARLEELSHFGEISLITNEPCSATVVCEEAGRLRHLSDRRFSERLRAHDPVAHMVVLNMARILARRLVRSDERLDASRHQ